MATDGTKKKKAGFNLKEASEPNTDDEKRSSQFSHSHQKTAHALTHAKMVEKGRKYWEEKENYERVTDVEWWKLKAAKDFETGIGQKFYRHGTLSTWTDEQIAALQKEMESTLQLAGYGDGEKPTVEYDAKQQLAPNKKVSAPPALDDFAAEIKRQQQQQSQPMNDTKKHTQNSTASTVVVTETEEDADAMYDFDDEIIHTGHSDEENDDEKQSKYDGSTVIFDPSQLKELTSMDELGRFEDTVAQQHARGHSRTRTAALRVKLQNMQTQLETVATLSQKQGQELEQKRTSQVVKEQNIQSQLSAMSGALESANEELDRAEEQIAGKDEEITNLKRELGISKQMNSELTQQSASNESDDTDDAGGLSAEDLLNQRIRDANRFAFMLSAMQEQLDFERKQFCQRIHNLELQVEHKDTQLNALYQLYNKLVSQTKTSSWWERWTK